MIDHDLERAMATVRTVVSLGHGLRQQHGVEVRRPLRSLTVVSQDPDVARAVMSHTDLIAHELNVKTTAVVESGAGLLTLSAKPDSSRLGPRLGARVKEVAAAIARLTPAEIEGLADGQGIEVAGTTITASDLVIDRQPTPGLAVAAASDLAVALDLASDPALEAEGLAREFVSKVQQLRRQQSLAVTDRIKLDWWTDDKALAAAIDAHRDYVSAEVLATELRQVEANGASGYAVDNLEGSAVGLRISRVG
ncbi:hypothetical protein BH18ACT5_BH18ACT5_03250 [soil metagenome]